MATEGTHRLLTENGIEVKPVKKLQEGRPNILDEITNGKIALIINTPQGSKKGAMDDSYIRKAAIKGRIPYMTTIAAAKASVEGIKAAKKRSIGVKSLQAFHETIR